MTVTITGPKGKPESPGDYDPMIPLKLYESQRDAKGSLPPSNTNTLSKIYLAMSLASGDASTPWYNLLPEFFSQPMSSPDEMIYQCDANLGAPIQLDCTHLEYSRFSTPSDTVVVGGETPTILSLSKSLSPPSVSAKLVADHRFRYVRCLNLLFCRDHPHLGTDWRCP